MQIDRFRFAVRFVGVFWGVLLVATIRLSSQARQDNDLWIVVCEFLSCIDAQRDDSRDPAIPAWSAHPAKRHPWIDRLRR
jgi:hypothetical protein